MMGLISKDTRSGGDGYGYLQTAIKNCRNRGIIWERVKGAWLIRCLDGGETIAASEKRIKHISRTAKTAGKLLKAVDSSTLNNEEKIAYNTKLAQVQAFALFSSKSTVKKLEARNVKTIDTTRMLESCFQTLP